MAMTIWWTPGHYNIIGNDAADAAARSATEGNVHCWQKLLQVWKYLKIFSNITKGDIRVYILGTHYLKQFFIEIWKGEFDLLTSNRGFI